MRGYARDDDGDQAWPPLPPSLDPSVQEALKDMPAGPEDNMQIRMPIYHPLQPHALKDSTQPQSFYLDGREVKGRPKSGPPAIYLTGHALIISGVLASTLSYTKAWLEHSHRPSRVRITIALNLAARAVGRYVPFIGFCVFTSSLAFSAARFFTRYRDYKMPVEPVLFTWAGIFAASKFKPIPPVMYRFGRLSHAAPLLYPILGAGLGACFGYWYIWSKTAVSGDAVNRIKLIDPRAYEHVFGPAATAAAAARFDRLQPSQEFERFSTARKSGAEPRDSKWD